MRFFFNDTATTEIYTLSLHDALPILLTDDRIRSIDDYLSAADVFPGVGLKGGVCYFLWDRDNPGPCKVSTHFKDWPVSDRKSTRLNSSHANISYAVFCLKKKKQIITV